MKLTILKRESTSWSSNNYKLELWQVRPYIEGQFPEEDESPVTPERPAREGEVIQIFRSDLGRVNLPVADGEPGPVFSASDLIL